MRGVQKRLDEHVLCSWVRVCVWRARQIQQSCAKTEEEVDARWQACGGKLGRQRELCQTEFGMYRLLHADVLQAASSQTTRKLPLYQQTCAALKATGNSAGHLPPDELLRNWKAMLSLSKGVTPKSLAEMLLSKKLPLTADMRANEVAVAAAGAVGTGHSTRKAGAQMQETYAALEPANAAKAKTLAASRTARASLQAHIASGAHRTPGQQQGAASLAEPNK